MRDFEQPGDHGRGGVAALGPYDFMLPAIAAMVAVGTQKMVASPAAVA
ncbi:hypothetical protein [Nonomuraea roseola]|uniref:Uncharacterized protein n=1 Tax=Nonomuraea roseola TaxID=46179 RepID=A0ABV5QE85_9ACTN